jgi:hypothetical protein
VDLLRRLGIKGIWENNEGNKWDVILEAKKPSCGDRSKRDRNDWNGWMDLSAVLR